MKTPVWLIVLMALLAGCATHSYKASMAAGPARPAGYPIPVYNPEIHPPRACQVIGRVSTHATGLTMMGGTVDAEMKAVMREARAKGADAVQLVDVTKPGFNNPNYRIQADLMRYTDDWEQVTISEKDLLTYFHGQTLDPIEGIWSDNMGEQIAIIRDDSRPGRNFIAFILNSSRPNWPHGYKKMDLARSSRPAAYNVTFYGDDFARSQTSFLLEHQRAFSFIVQTGDTGYLVIFEKTNPIIPEN